jgi:GT2 family glycosyltransferase
MMHTEPPLPSMLAIIVNYRTGTLVVECLASLEQEVRAMPGFRVIVVDNASGDDSAVEIDSAIRARGWGNWAELAASPVNGGFASGNNHAIRRVLAGENPPDLIWLVNPDTVVRPGAGRALAAFMRDHPKAGIAGSALQSADGTPWPYAFRFPTILGETERGARLGLVSRLLASHAIGRTMGQDAAQVDWVSGASMVIRRAVFADTGLMDEGYFLYYEETDFCLQAQRAGWECWYVPEAVVLHISGQSTGVTAATTQPKRIPRYWFESRRRYFVKNHGRAYAITADLGWAGMHVLWRLRQLILRRRNPDPPRMLGDFLRYSALFRA